MNKIKYIIILASLCLVSLPIMAAELGLPISGVIAKVKVKVGQTVKKGDLLLSLDSRALAAKIAAAQSQYRLTSILLEEAQREDERAEELYERTVLSEHDRVEAKIVLRRAQAAHKNSQAELVKSKMNLQYSRLVAPFDGSVEKLFAYEGQAVVNTNNIQTLMLLVP